MSTPFLSTLRQPPIVGQFYMVPVVSDYPYHGKIGAWPVIGPKHTDADFFRFPDEHYHVDARFLTKAQADFLGRLRYVYAPNIEHVVGARPLVTSLRPLPKGRPKLARRKCTSATYGHAFTDRSEVKRLQEHFDSAPAILLSDGRKLCPHRKADLSSFPPDAEGYVVCPLHGLRVRCAEVVGS